MRKILLATIFFLFLTRFLNGEDLRKVLVLNSYHEDYCWTNRIMKGIRSQFDNQKDIEIFVEDMDTKRHVDKEYYQYLKQILMYKYKNYKFDVILSTDDNALNFLLEFGDEIFPDTPVVFSGINSFKPERIENKNNYTGVYEIYDVEGTIELMETLHPDVENIYVILDDSVTANVFFSEIKAAEKAFATKVQFTYLRNLSRSEMYKKLDNLTDKDLILWAIYLRTPQGEYISPERSIDLISSYVDNPIYCLWDVVGQGVVGGKIVNPESQGRISSKMALQILQGNDVGNLPVKGTSLEYIFDYNQLRKYGILEISLPADSIILNRPFSVYKYFKVLIWTIFSFIIFLLAIIIFLGYNIHKRRVAEKDLKLTYEELLHSNRMDAIGQLSGGLAHDFRNHVAAVISAAELLRLSDFPKDEDSGQLLQVIENASSTAMDLVSQLMLVSRKEAVEFSSISMHKVIDNVLLLLKGSLNNKINLKINKEAKFDIVNGEISQLDSSIMNICINAGHAMPEGGDLSIETTNVFLNRSGCNLSLFDIEPGEYLKINIKDSGEGISKENISKVFEPFFTTKDAGQGTGLGLSVVYGIVKSHKGCISVSSKPGKGTIFHIHFPVVTAKTTP